MSVELNELQKWKVELKVEKEELEKINNEVKEEVERLKIRLDTLEVASWSWRISDPKAAESFSKQASGARATLEQKEADFKIKNREIQARVNEIERLLTTIEARIAQV
ncbi:hypothetical protein NSQ24_01380 [Brevibacillus sp. FSL L8-0520]|uniref:hypothetical protein n=1 Tax=Brevibacillus sp. FSL L8-0520 TaxID=2954689 RepID=UPI0030CF98FA